MDNAILNRRERLVLTAIDVINEMGIQGLSTREVAKRQGMSNAVLFSHFKSKNELMLAILDHFTQYDRAILQAIKANGYKSKDAIVYFIDCFSTYYENYPAITAIVQSYDVLRCEPELSKKVTEILSDRGICVKQMVEEAQIAGQIRADVDSESISDIILGTCRNICLRWRISAYTFPLKERTLKTLNIILDSFTPK